MRWQPRLRAVMVMVTSVFMICAGYAGVASGAAANPARTTSADARALASGLGWSASWRYISTDAFQYRITVPGGMANGFVADSGTRVLLGTVSDTALDGRCVVGVVGAVGEGNLLRRVCDGDPPSHFVTGAFSRDLEFTTRLEPPPGSPLRAKTIFLDIPSSAADSALRTVGTGASWDYYTETSFRYTVTRPGVSLVGFGRDQGIGRRLVASSVEHTGAADTCVTGRTSDTFNSVGNRICTPGAFTTFAGFFTDFTVRAEGCVENQADGSTACLEARIPQPN